MRQLGSRQQGQPAESLLSEGHRREHLLDLVGAPHLGAERLEGGDARDPYDREGNDDF